MCRGAETVQIVATSRSGSQGQCSVTVEGLAGLYHCVSRVGREGSFPLFMTQLRSLYSPNGHC